jgi:predicted AlkP superfamily pyrophosphatase or phosphodiesterase
MSVMTSLRRRAGWLVLAAALAMAAGPSGLGAKPLNPNAPKKPPPSTEKPKGGPAAPRLARRVVVVSLDGAGAAELQQLWRDDLLDEGGFARFFREGEVASALVPVDPTLAAPNHVSLATGAAPDRTGIVGNHFHPAGAPDFAKASGFDFPIGAETLWEAARRQRKRVAAVAWPGIDGSEPRLRADVGFSSVAGAERDPQLLVLKRSDWQAAAGAPRLASPSRSPVLGAHVALGGASGVGAAEFDLYAVDRTGDGQESYDSVVVAASIPAGAAAGGKAGGAQATRAPSVANLEQSEPLGQGQWAEVIFPDRGGRSACWVKVLALDPGLEEVRLYFTGTYRLQAWPADYAKDLAESNLFWPGPPDDRRLAAAWHGQPGIDLDTWTEQAARFAAFFGGAMRRIATGRDDWDLMLGCIPVIDQAGHSLLLADSHQSGYSAARRDELARARRKVWQAVDHELRLLMAALDLGRTTVVVVSDHGMAPVHTVVDLNALLRERGWLASPAMPAARSASAARATPAARAVRAAAGGGGGAGDGIAAYAIGDGGTAHLYPAKAAAAPDAAARQRQLLELRDQLLAWRSGDDTPIERVLTRQEAADLGLDHPNSGDLILFANEGYAFDPGPEPSGAATVHPAPAYGMHGYLAAHPAMQGVYLAIGKDVKPGSASAAVQATDVAGRVARWLGMGKPAAAAAAGVSGR